MKQLSGGERSLCTLAFVLALGASSIQPPFHALDEFGGHPGGLQPAGGIWYKMQPFFIASTRQRPVLPAAALMRFAWNESHADVFMDAPNRRMALSFLIEFALKHAFDRQVQLALPLPAAHAVT